MSYKTGPLVLRPKIVDIPVREIIEELSQWGFNLEGVVANAIAEQAIRNSFGVFFDTESSHKEGYAGNLRRSIVAGKFKDRSGYVGAFAPHAHLLEYGYYVTPRGLGKSPLSVKNYAAMPCETSCLVETG